MIFKFGNDIPVDFLSQSLITALPTVREYNPHWILHEPVLAPKLIFNQYLLEFGKLKHS